MSERRRVEFRCSEMRAEERDGARVIRGTASVFDAIYSVGGWWYETFRRGAFAKTLNESANIMVLYQHEVSMPLGSTRAQTAKVWADEAGLHFEAVVPETTAGRDAYESIRRGDVTGASIEFEAVKDGWTKEWRDGKELREIFEARLFEASPVTFPASPETSSAARAEVGEAAREVRDARALARGDEGRDQQNRRDTRKNTEANGTTDEPGADPHSAAGAGALEVERLRFAQYQLTRKGILS